MPYVDVTAKVSFYYEVRGAGGKDGIDPGAPYIVALSPMGMQLEFLYPVFEDKRAERYNVVLIDLIAHGLRTKYDPQVWNSYWTQAVLLNRALDALKIPPFHMLAGQGVGGQVMAMMVRLFPHRALSMSFASVIPIAEHTVMVQTWRDIHDVCMFSCDAEEVLEANKASFDACMNPIVAPKWSRLVLRQWGNVYSQRNALNHFVCWYPLTEQTQYGLDDLASIVIPVLSVHGGSDPSFPLRYADRFKAGVTSSPYVETHIIDDAPNFLVMTHADVFRDLFFSFLSRIPVKFTEASPWQESDYHASLALMAEITGEPERLELDPFDPKSYTRVLPEDMAIRIPRFARLQEREQNPTLWPEYEDDLDAPLLPELGATAKLVEEL